MVAVDPHHRGDIEENFSVARERGSSVDVLAAEIVDPARTDFIDPEASVDFVGSVDAVRLYRSPAGPAYSHARRTQASRADSFSGDITVTDAATGELLAEIRGMRLQYLEASPPNAASSASVARACASASVSPSVSASGTSGKRTCQAASSL